MSELNTPNQYQGISNWFGGTHPSVAYLTLSQQLGEVMARLFRRATTRTPVRRSGVGKHLPLSPELFKFHHQQLHKLVSTKQFDDDQRRSLCYQIGQATLSGSRSMKGPNFALTSTSDLQSMAEKYDQHFFDGHCLALARHFGLQFRWSNRMTSNGGKTVRTVHGRQGTQRVSYEIVLSAPLLFQTFSDLKRPIRVTGILCSNRLQAMQRIMEHELIHLVEMLVWEDSCCASPRFQNIAARLFGHTEHKHDLVTQQERADQKFNIRVGTRVCFRYEGQTRVGTVNRITRRATVLVVDPTGQLYDDGNRYRKYYVPLSHLSPAR